MSELKTIGDACNFLHKHGIKTRMIDDSLMQNAVALKKIIENSIPKAKIQELIDKLWDISVDGKMKIKDAGIYQDICDDLKKLIKPEGE